MEVKPGYKQTEMGVIPVDWDVKPLSTLAGKIMVGIASAATHAYRTKGVPMFRNQNIKAGHLDDEDVLYIDPEYEKTYRNKRLQGGDLLTARTGYPGTTCVVPSRYESAQSFTTLITRPNTTEIDSSFLCVYINSEAGQKFFEQGQIGGAQKNVNAGTLRNMPVPIPPPPEQRAIATALSDVDGLLGGLDRLIAKKRGLKQAVMQQLLTGQTRLPGFHGEWEVKTLFELAERKKELFDDGDWIESEHITTEGIRLIQTGNIGVGKYVEKDEKKYIYEASFTSLRCKQLRHGDLLICRLADPAGRACVLTDIGEERIVTSVDVTIFRPPHEVANRLFLSNVFSTPEWFRAVSDRSGGTTHKRISRGALGRLAITLPPLPEQTAIATVLTEMDAELAVLEQRREKTHALKQAMMQELLTGRIRLI
ncbi:MAG: restriction endonuclease subunit S [Chromatiaceae bacterium]